MSSFDQELFNASSENLTRQRTEFFKNETTYVKRLIHNWDVPKGTLFVASLPYVGHTFKLKKP